MLLAILTALSAPLQADATPCGISDCPLVEDLGATLEAGDPGNSVAVDVTSLFENGPSPDALAVVLRTLADEPQEAAYARLELRARGSVGTGAVNADLAAQVALDLRYQITDQNRTVLSFTLEGALEAGVNIADLVRFGGRVEVDGDFIRLAFPDSNAAAAWLTDQLDDLNRQAEGQFWPVTPEGSTHIAPGDEPLSKETFDVAVAGTAQVRAGGFEGLGEVEYRESRVHYQGILNGEELDLTTLIQRYIGRMEASVPVRGDQLSVGFTRDWNYTTGSPFYYANGVFIEETYDVRIPVRVVQRIISERSNPRSGIQDLVTNAFAGIERVLPGRALPNANYSLFSAATNHIYEEARRTNRVGASSFITVSVVNHYFGENDGSENRMYTRVLIGGEQTAELDLNARVAQVETRVRVGVNEVVYESVGSDTVSYINRQFVYQTDDRPWTQFVARNREAVDGLLQNMSTPGTLYYDEGVAAAYSDGGFDAGLAAVEALWTGMEDDLSGARQAAIELARISNSWFMAMRYDSLAAQAAQILETTDDPRVRAYMLDLVDDFGGTPEDLEYLTTDDDAASQRLRGLFDGAQPFRAGALTES